MGKATANELHVALHSEELVYGGVRIGPDRYRANGYVLHVEEVEREADRVGRCVGLRLVVAKERADLRRRQ